MEVVEQPLAGGADVDAAIGTAVGGRGKPRVRVLQDVAGTGEAGQERGAPPAAPGGQALPRGEGLRALTEVLGPQQLAADGAGEKVLPGRGAARDKAGEKAGRLQRRDGEGLGRREGQRGPGSVSWNEAV
jgi:hypothetical protein